MNIDNVNIRRPLVKIYQTSILIDVPANNREKIILSMDTYAGVINTVKLL